MSSPAFQVATIEETNDRGVRVRGNAGNLDWLGKKIQFIFIGFGFFASIFILVIEITSEGINGLGYAIETTALILLFFILGAFFVRYIFFGGTIYLFRLVFRHHKLWWDDFTFDGKTVKSRKYKFDVSEISQVKKSMKKFDEVDNWYYASIINTSGTEIGRVMVVRNDHAKMVNYLSKLFGID